MKKNMIIIVLIIITGISMFYAFLKANEAAGAADIARINQVEAEMLRDQAVAMQQAAQEAAAEAKRQQALVMEAIQKCQDK